MRDSWRGLCPTKQGLRVFPNKSQFSICFKGGAAIETFQPAIINLDHQSIEFDDHTQVARRLKGSSRLRRAHENEREPATPAPRQPERLAALRQAWVDWNALMPPIPEDAAVSLGYSAKDLPQR